MTEHKPTITLVGELLTEPSVRPERASLPVVHRDTGRHTTETVLLQETLTFVLRAALVDPVSGAHRDCLLRCDDPQGLSRGLTCDAQVEVVGTLHTERVTRRDLDRTYLALVLEDLVPLDHLTVA